MNSPEIDIKPIWNIGARPDLLTVGIEQVWAKAKYFYRNYIDRFKGLSQQYDHMGLV